MTTKTKTTYDRVLLDQIIARDGATLVGTYEKLNCESIITFKCTCGTEYQKNFKQITISKMLCKVCTKNNKIEKTKKTNLERYGVEYVKPDKKTPLERFGTELHTICLKYQIEPSPENQEKLKLALQARICSYIRRDLDKQKKYITFDEAKMLNNHKINTFYCQHVNDTELPKLDYLDGKIIAELTTDDLSKLCNYITITGRPMLLRCNSNKIVEWDNKYLVKEIPELNTLNYNDLVDILILNSNECVYCKCKMTLLNTKYAETRLTFDAIEALKGHRKDNIILCCHQCNSKKGNFRLKEEDSEDELTNEIIQPSPQ